MKWQGLLAFVLLFHIHHPAAFKTRSLDYAHDQVTEASDSFAGLQQEQSPAAFLDTSSGTSEVALQRAELLDRLRYAEAAAEQEQHTLQSQQQVILGLAQTQHMLESKIEALEFSPQAGPFDGTGRPHEFMAAGSLRQARAVPEHFHHHHQKRPNGIIRFLGYSDADTDQFWKDSSKAFWANIIAESVYVVLVFVGGLLYIEYFKNLPPKLPEAQLRVNDWQYGCCDCTDFQRDCQICVCGLCCVPIRWADTASTNVGNGGWVFMGFIPALLVFVLLSACSAITFGISGLILLLITVLCRQRIRQLYNIPAGDFHSLCSDCLLWCFCSPCAVIQEARQIDLVEVPSETLNQGLIPTGYGEDRTQYAAGNA